MLLLLFHLQTLLDDYAAAKDYVKVKLQTAKLQRYSAS
jgi:hypothetical protein